MSRIKNFLALFSGRPGGGRPGEAETIRLLFSRRSCRSFSPEELSPEDVQTILEAGRFAPSTVNLQTWTFITFNRAQWRETFDRPIPFGAAFAITVCADIFRIGPYFPDFSATPHVNLCLAIFNAGLAAMSMNIAAEALGIRSVMLSETGGAGLLDFGQLATKLGLPEGVIPLTTLALGKGGMQLPGIPPRQPPAAVISERGYDRSAGELLADWYEQMFIGYKLTHPLSGFDRQIAYYRKKMAEAEKSMRQAFSPAPDKKKPEAC